MRRGPKSRRRRSARSSASSPTAGRRRRGPGGPRPFGDRNRPSQAITAPGEGVLARQRAVKPLVELRVPFELEREQIDDVERGSNDSDWQPAKDAAQNRLCRGSRHLRGLAAAQIEGIRRGRQSDPDAPADVRSIRTRSPRPLSQLRLVGVNGPYSVVLGADAYTALAETVDNGYPVLEHVKKLVKDEIIWAPAIDGAFVLTTRGGDFDLHIGQDVSIGYLSHTDTVVRLYLQETLTFLMHLRSRGGTGPARGDADDLTPLMGGPIDGAYIGLCRAGRNRHRRTCMVHHLVVDPACANAGPTAGRREGRPSRLVRQVP